MSVFAEDKASWVDDLRHKNPLDHEGRSANVISLLLSRGEDPGVSLCPVCGEVLHLRDGDYVAPYLAHACDELQVRCPGSGSETEWHKAAKRAVLRFAGWQEERNYEPVGRVFRADAINEDEQHVFEAVHSLSSIYVEKHRLTKQSGRQVTWLFDGSASFCRPLPAKDWRLPNRWIARFDGDYARNGQLVARGLLRKRARRLVAELGPASCFIHFAGLAFQCFQSDEDLDDMWGLCGDQSLPCRVVFGEGGLNDQLIKKRASGIDIAAIGLGTDHTPHAGDLLQLACRHATLVDLRRDEMKEAWSSHRDQPSATKSLWVDPSEWPGWLVNLSRRCLCGSDYGVDVPIHEGQSVRRDCAQCRKFLGWRQWYGKMEATDGTHP